MNINDLIVNVKKKLKQNINTENILIEEKKFHLKIEISSKELKKLSKIERYKKVYKILDHELKNNIHSLQILIN